MLPIRCGFGEFPADRFGVAGFHPNIKILKYTELVSDNRFLSEFLVPRAVWWVFNFENIPAYAYTPLRDELAVVRLTRSGCGAIILDSKAKYCCYCTKENAVDAKLPNEIIMFSGDVAFVPADIDIYPFRL